VGKRENKIKKKPTKKVLFACFLVKCRISTCFVGKRENKIKKYPTKKVLFATFFFQEKGRISFKKK